VSVEQPQLQPVIQLELRPDKKDSPSFKMLVDAVLSAAREELAWREENHAAAASAESPLAGDPGQAPGYPATQPMRPCALAGRVGVLRTPTAPPRSQVAPPPFAPGRFAPGFRRDSRRSPTRPESPSSGSSPLTPPRSSQRNVERGGER